MKTVIIFIIGFVISGLFITPRLFPSHPIEPRTCPVDTLVVIRDTWHEDSSKIKGAGVFIDGQSIQRDPLFANGRHRDTIYESKIVYK